MGSTLETPRSVGHSMDDLSIDSDEEHVPMGMILGENECPAYKKNTSACVHLFFNVVPDTDIQEVHEFLENAWQEDPLLTMKIIFNLGNVRKDGAGKQDRLNFYYSVLWLWKKRPECVLNNVRLIHQHTSLKCLLDILMHIVHMDQDTQFNLDNQVVAREEHKQHKLGIRGPVEKKKRREERNVNRLKIWTEFAQSLGKENYSELRQQRPKEDLKTKDQNILRDPRVTSRWISQDITDQFQQYCKKRDALLKQGVKSKKKDEKAQLKEIITSAKENETVRRLYAEVISIFTEGIKEELSVMKEIEAGSKKTVGGLYSKWAPKEHGMHDRATGISHDLMFSLLPAAGERIDRASQTYQRILSKVHEAAQVPEHYVGSGRFSEVNYDRMASRCRLFWGEKVFKANDGERYDAYLAKSAVTALTESTAKEGVKTGVLLPHELVDKAFDMLDSRKFETDKMKQVELNLQWRGLVKSARSALMAGEGCGVCLPMADVSGSMNGTPMSVSIALSMLVAESTPKTEPFHGKILTFSTRPKICDLKNIPDYDAEVDASSLQNVDKILEQLGNFAARVEEVRNYNWGGSTNIEAAYDLLLEIAKANKLSREYVEKICLVIFSDMEFNSAVNEYGYGRRRRTWTTMHEHIARKFSLAGYPNLPRTVFWNLRSSASQPVRDAQEEGVVLLSGFSSALLKAFLKGDWEGFTPLGQMKQALSGPMYEKIVYK